VIGCFCKVSKFLARIVFANDIPTSLLADRNNVSLTRVCTFLMSFIYPIKKSIQRHERLPPLFLDKKTHYMQLLQTFQRYSIIFMALL